MTWHIRDIFEFAKHWHREQFRKNSGEPYINHPVRVALMAGQFGLGVHAQAAALLHDVIEDTPATLDQVLEVTDGRVTEIVWGLSNYGTRYPAKGETMNRTQRKAADRAYLRRQEPTVKNLKLLDMIDNLQSGPVSEDRGFNEIYLEELRQLAMALEEPCVDGPSGGTLEEIRDLFWDSWQTAYDAMMESAT